MTNRYSTSDILYSIRIFRYSTQRNEHSHEELVGLGLRRAIGVGRVEEIVDAHEHLLDRDRRPPPLVLIQNAVIKKPIRKQRDACHVAVRGETVVRIVCCMIYRA